MAPQPLLPLYNQPGKPTPLDTGRSQLDHNVSVLTATYQHAQEQYAQLQHDQARASRLTAAFHQMQAASEDLELAIKERDAARAHSERARASPVPKQLPGHFPADPEPIPEQKRGFEKLIDEYGPDVEFYAPRIMEVALYIVIGVFLTCAGLAGGLRVVKSLLTAGVSVCDVLINVVKFIVDVLIGLGVHFAYLLGILGVLLLAAYITVRITRRKPKTWWQRLWC